MHDAYKISKQENSSNREKAVIKKIQFGKIRRLFS